MMPLEEDSTYSDARQEDLLDQVLPSVIQSARQQVHTAVSVELAESFEAAIAIVEAGAENPLKKDDPELWEKVVNLAAIKHAARGALLTLALYKAAFPSQDIRRVKVEHDSGFSARTIDSIVTVPFLMKHSLPRSVETHWLTQTFSIASAPWERSTILKTSPIRAGKLLIDVANDIEDSATPQKTARSVAASLLVGLIEVRNRSRVSLTRPKNMTVADTGKLLKAHFNTKYKTGSPRLPQIAIYAMYVCILRDGAGRYSEAVLEPIGRMKAADRKSGTVGDIVLSRSGLPVEAVEVKLGVKVGLSIVGEAMEKVKSASVLRYYILSTAGFIGDEESQVADRIDAFRRSNGCEIVVDDVLRTILYALRFISSTTAYIDAYAELLSEDDDLDYEHRVAWNELCAALGE